MTYMKNSHQEKWNHSKYVLHDGLDIKVENLSSPARKLTPNVGSDYEGMMVGFIIPENKASPLFLGEKRLQPGTVEVTPESFPSWESPFAESLHCFQVQNVGQ